MNEYLDGLLEKALKPISEENPCGDNARYDERYERSKNEIMKLTAGGAGVDWRGVREGIEGLLADKTKDLTLAAYLCLALLKEYDYPGLLVGLQIVDGFLENWWEDLFPPAKRLKARVQIFEWMDERLSALVGVTEPKSSDADAVRKCKEVADGLPEKVQNLAKTQVTGFSQFRTAINQWVERLPAPAPKEPEKPVEEKPSAEAPGAPESASPTADQPTAGGAPAPAAAPTPVPAPTSAPAAAPATAMALPPPVEDIASTDAGIKAILNIVKLIRAADPLGALAYHLSRVLKWDMVDAEPPAGADGKTQIPAPSQQMLTVLSAQYKAANWVDLIGTAENLFVSQGVFFLDLQKYVYYGLQNQGAGEAAKVVMLETGRMLQRLPLLVNMSYVTGLPFADDETRMWAQEAVKAAAGPGTAAEDDDKSWLGEATKAAAKSMAAALPVLQDAISRAENTKNVMKRQRDVAKFFVSNREYQWAMPLLESLHEKIETVGLAQWEPEFCSEVWELMLSGYTAIPGGAQANGKDDRHLMEIRQKLFETNIAKAAAVTPKEKKK